MYEENKFVVDYYGAGLILLGQPLGFADCAEYCSNKLTIGSLNIILGSEDHDILGSIRSRGMTFALNDMAQPIAVKHLRIDFLPFFFAGDKDLSAFAEALGQKIKVEAVLEMVGLDVHWEWDLRSIPMALKMKLQPLHCEYKRYNDERNVRGFCGCSYEPAANENQILGLDENGNELDIVDGKLYFERHEWDLYHGTGNEE
ncbi:MAG: hypothetical protein Q9220_006438 [cf. Caloplaca sp. 1 TL-2023]